MYVTKNVGLTFIWSLILIFWTCIPVFADGKVRAPKVGERTVWTCKGPWTQTYDLTVEKVNDGVITYKGSRNGENYYVLKRVDYLGTTLWSKYGEDKFQYIDPHYFSDLKNLQFGAVIKGPVPAAIEKDKWVWEYEIGVGKAKKADVPNVGTVAVVEITEHRSIFHGTYNTKMQSIIVPSLGITLRWKFSDPVGEEECWLTKYDR